MTKLIIYVFRNGKYNGATLEGYNSQSRYFRVYLPVRTALTDNCPDIYYQYPVSEQSFVDYLKKNEQLPSLDADSIIDAYGCWDFYADMCISNHCLPDNDFFRFLDMITKVVPNKLRVSRTVISAPEELVGGL